MRASRVFLVLVVVTALGTGATSGSAVADGPTTTLVSVASSGSQGNRDSDEPAISADGRYVTFTSPATNLVPDDTNNADDVFLRDRTTGTTTRVSVSSSGVQANHHSGLPAVNADGRYVTFISNANNLVPDDTNGFTDVFVRDQFSGPEPQPAPTVVPEPPAPPQPSPAPTGTGQPRHH